MDVGCDDDQVIYKFEIVVSSILTHPLSKYYRAVEDETGLPRISKKRDPSTDSEQILQILSIFHHFHFACIVSPFSNLNAAYLQD